MSEDEGRRPPPRITGWVKPTVWADSGSVQFGAPDYEQILGPENPFAVDHRFHAEWDARRRAAAAEAAELHARVLAQLQARIQAQPRRRWSAVLDYCLEWWPGVFNIQAHGVMGLAPPVYRAWLSARRAAILSDVRRLRLGIDDELLPMLTAQLQARHAHWVAQADAADQQERRALHDRAVWLQAVMDREGLVPGSFKKVRGPDAKSIRKILNEEPVSERVLVRTAVALGVKRADIP